MSVSTVKRLKEFAAEEKERRKMGLTDEAAYERFAVVRSFCVVFWFRYM